jgi:hypothetical protein
VALLLLVAAGFLLGADSAVGPLLGVAIPSVGIVGGLLCRRFLPVAGRTLSTIPIVAGLSVVAALDPISATGELTAGGAGLALLLWLSSEPYPRGRWMDVVGALLLPSIAVVIGIVASLALPGAPNAFGAAAGLLVTELLFAAWLYSHPGELADAGRSPTPASI